MILLAKAERSDFLHLTMVNAAELTKELFTKAQTLAKRDWQLDEIAHGQIVVDRDRITEAIMNLVQNATQHTQPEDTIAIGSTIAKDKVRFWVRDTGEGIPLPDQKRIFARFARATNSRRRLEGSGLGLSIVKAIAEAHGGQILLHSKLGSGSMFTLVLPLDPPQEVIVHVPYPHRRG
jgi:signal transduction histidine kinase